MKLHSLLAAGLAATIFCTSCSNSGNDSSATTGMDSAQQNSHVDSTTGTSGTSAEQSFINDAVTANTQELAWINAALKQSTSPAIKAMAMKMKTDHENLKGQVEGWLSNHTNVTAPMVDTTNIVDQSKGGAAWDSAWMAKMKSDHQATLDKLNQGKQTVTDTGLLRVINGAIPVVESHARMLNGMK